MTRTAVMGAGSWGTAFGMVLADAGGDVVLWAKDAELVAAVNATAREPRLPPGDPAAGDVRATTDAAEALDGAEVVVLALPAQALRGQPHRMAAVAAARGRRSSAS